MVKDNTIELFLDDLASQKGTPGDGSAAALIGAIAAALVSMVCNLTIGKARNIVTSRKNSSLFSQKQKNCDES